MSATTAGEGTDRSAYVLRRLHSLTGVVPVGVFLVMHLWTNASALGGPEAFDHAVGRIQALPMLWALEAFGIFLPLAFHAGYGVVLATRGRANVGAYPFGGNWLYLLQRVSGALVLVFVVAHLWEFRAQKAFYGMGAASFHTTLEAHLSWTWGGVPFIAIGYVLGLASTLFHFGNGLATAAISWGVVTSRRAYARLGKACLVFSVALFFLSVATVIQLATGTRLLPAAGAGKSAPCDAPRASPEG